MGESFVTGQESVKEATRSAICLVGGEELLFSDRLVQAALGDTGVSIGEMQHRSASSFDHRGKMNGVVYAAATIRQLRYERYEELRQKTVGKVIAAYRERQAAAVAAGGGDAGPVGGATAIAMMEQQGAQLLAQEQKKAAEMAASRAARAAADAAAEEQAEQLRQANAAKQVAILREFERQKAEFDATVKRRREEAQEARMARVRKKQEDFEASVIDGRRKEARRLQRDKEIMARQAVRQEEMQARALAFAKKRAEKIAGISQVWADVQAKADKVADEKERLVLEKAAVVAARAEAKQAAVIKANRKKQREIQRRLAAKNAADKAEDDAKDKQFAEKIATCAVDPPLPQHTDSTLVGVALVLAGWLTCALARSPHPSVNARLETFKLSTAKQIARRIKDRQAQEREREQRQEQLRLQREMAGSSGLDKAEMKAVRSAPPPPLHTLCHASLCRPTWAALCVCARVCVSVAAARMQVICAQAFERKRDSCLSAAVENQMRYHAKVAYMRQQKRIEGARVARMTEEAEAKAARSQAVIDAKLAMREKRKEEAKRAVVARAKFSSKARLPRGMGDVPPMDWMLNPLAQHFAQQGKMASMECRRRASDSFNIAPSGLPARAASSMF
jgi:hypothetical protein